MKATDLAKVPTGSLVTWSRKPRAHWYGAHVAVLVRTCKVQTRDRNYRATTRNGAVVRQVAGNGTSDNPYRLGDELEVGCRHVLDNLGYPGEGEQRAFDFVKGLRDLDEANRQQQRQQQREAEHALQDKALTSIAWLESFGLTVRFAGRIKGVPQGEYGSDVILDSCGKVTIDLDLLKGLLAEPE